MAKIIIEIEPVGIPVRYNNGNVFTAIVEALDKLDMINGRDFNIKIYSQCRFDQPIEWKPKHG